MAIPVWFEIGSLVVLTLILIADLLIIVKRPHIPSTKESALWVAFYVTLALAFAGAYVLLQAARNIFMLWATARHDPSNFLNFARIGLWHMADAILWIAGALADGPARIALWGAAVALDRFAVVGAEGLRQ